jgi:hypothetical protein
MATNDATAPVSIPALDVGDARLGSIAYRAVGIYTEGGPTPYTGASNAGGASVISIGVMQNDFDECKLLADPKAKLTSLVVKQGKWFVNFARGLIRNSLPGVPDASMPTDGGSPLLELLSLQAASSRFVRPMLRWR